ncbi:hypothetical protein [Sinorhizobium meliloti]|uniref:ATP dependent DNA ligase n=1 Tax=Rhizobium meliloti TaxID=382 RepID=UPI003F5CEFA8
MLHLDGNDLRRLPLHERRRLLEPLVAGREGAIRLSEEVQGDGASSSASHARTGWKASSPSMSRSPTARAVASGGRRSPASAGNRYVGFEPSTVPGHLGRLLLAARKDGALAYVGGCGTGWSNDLSRELQKLLEGMATKTPAVDLRREGAVFVEPVLVAEVEYRAWTDDGKLRHASFKGIREREDDVEIYSLER